MNLSKNSNKLSKLLAIIMTVVMVFGALPMSANAENKYLTTDTLSLYAIKANKETSAIALTYDSESASFSGKLNKYTDTGINDADIKVEIKGLPVDAKATLTKENGEKIADFVNGVATTENGAVKKEGDYTFGITVEAGGEVEKCTLKLSKSIIVRWKALAFSAVPEFSADNVYNGQPEGTLFQLDDNGNRTGETGVAEYCRNYEVYISNKTAAIKFKGENMGQLFQFSYNDNSGNSSAAIYVNGELIAKDLRMKLCKTMAGKEMPIVKSRTEMQIVAYPDTDNKIITKVTFIMQGTINADSLKEELGKLDVTKLVYPDDMSYVAKLERDFALLSEEEQAQIPKDLQEKITYAKEVMRADREPQKLEITESPVKTIYGVGQKFSPTGLKLLATYADGSTRTITNTDDYTYEPQSELTLNDKSVTFTYNTAKVTLDITVRTSDKLNLKGNGTENDPYKLSSASDMTELSEYVAAGGKTEGMFFVMTNDITLPEKWTPIGVTNDGSVDIKRGANFTPFSGSLDGKNHTLTVPKGGLPLLGYIKAAEVKNLKIYGEQIEGYGLVNNFEGVGLSGSAIIIDNVTIKSGTKTLKSGLLGGNITTNGFAGNSAGFVATVKNCTVEKDVVIGYTGDQSYIGSIAGRMQGTIENCTSYATVKGVDLVGGILGTRDNAIGLCSVSNCTFEGEVISTGRYAGGISGAMYIGAGAPNGDRIDITDCKVGGTITGNQHVGGIVGGDPIVYQSWGLNHVTGNAFYGKISGNENVGGIIGFYRSLNKWDDISNNTYTLDCGADKGIGRIEYIDTNYQNPTAVEGTTYVCSENALTGVSGMTRKDLNRTDDPLGADSEKLAKGIYSEKQLDDMAKADAVESLIDAIGEVTLERGKAIEAAEDAYDALTDEQKALVENYDTLLKARAEYNKLKAEYVEGLIEKLPKADEITLKDGDNVKSAGDAYDKLTEDQKKLVSADSVKKLESVRAAYAKIAPKTGDSMSIAIYAIMLVAAAATGTVVYKKKKKA